MIINKKTDELKEILRKVDELEAKGKLTEAISETKRAIKLKPDDGNLYNRLGDICVKNKNIEEAISSYKKGIEAFRSDNFFRNALALCKKVLRYHPQEIEIYHITGELLIELGEKSDALMFLFEYIKRLQSLGNKKEVIRILEYIKKLGITDKKVAETMSKIYKEIGKPEMAKEVVSTPIKEKIIPEKMVSAEATGPQKFTEEPIIRQELKKFDDEKGRLKEDIAHLDEVVKDIDRTIAELRKAVRLDEVILTLDKSLTAFSNEQKEALAFLQKSMGLNLDILQKSIAELNQSSGKNIGTLEVLLNNLTKTLANLSKNQADISHQMNTCIEKLGYDFNTNTEKAVGEIKGQFSDFQKATREMSNKLEETKRSNVSLLNIFQDVKLEVQRINDSLVRFIISQDVKANKQGRYIVIITVIIGIICGALIFSIIR